MKDTAIEWCDSTLNLQMGCDGCELWTAKKRHCYAGVLTERYGGQKGWPVSFDRPAIFPERLQQALSWSDLTGTDRPDKPWLNGLPRIIFLDDMGDTFTESLAIDWLLPFIPQMVLSPHRWLILTKRAKRMATFFKHYLGYVPDNFWLGISATDQRTYNGRAQYLMTIDARVRFVSLEPLLSPIIIESGYMPDWVISGGESGPSARPCHPDWVRGIRDQCGEAGIPYFWKQWGEWAPDCLCRTKEAHTTIPRPQPGLPGVMFRCGKKAAGHMLDGRAHQEMPTP